MRLQPFIVASMICFLNRSIYRRKNARDLTLGGHSLWCTGYLYWNLTEFSFRDPWCSVLANTLQNNERDQLLQEFTHLCQKRSLLPSEVCRVNHADCYPSGRSHQSLSSLSGCGSRCDDGKVGDLVEQGMCGILSSVLSLCSLSVNVFTVPKHGSHRLMTRHRLMTPLLVSWCLNQNGSMVIFGEMHNIGMVIIPHLFIVQPDI